MQKVPIIDNNHCTGVTVAKKKTGRDFLTKDFSVSKKNKLKKFMTVFKKNLSFELSQNILALLL